MISKDDKGREFDERPWGNFTVIDDDMFDHKIKRIVVSPGKRLSYQQHAKRAEHWSVQAGASTSNSVRRIAARIAARRR